MADAPLGYWRLDTATGFNEATASNNTLVGTPTLVPGKDGNTAWSVNQNVAINLTGNYQDFTADNTFSVEAWFKRGISSAPSYPTIWRRDGNGRTALVRMRDSAFTPDNTGPGRVEVYLSNGTTSTNFYTTARYDDNQWHHLVMTVSGTGATAGKLYIDNVLVNTFNNPGNLSYLSSAGSSAIVAGGPDPSNGEGWAGGIDEIALYGTALSAARITAHYNARPSNVDVTIAAPAMVTGLSAPVPVIKTSIGAPAITTQTTFVTPKISAGYGAIATNDNNGDGTATYLDVSASDGQEGRAFLKFADFNQGRYPEKSDLKITTQQIVGPVKFTIYRLMESFAGNTTLGRAFNPAYDNDGVEVDLGSDPAFATGTQTIDITKITRRWALGAPNYGIVILAPLSNIPANGVGYSQFRITDETGNPTSARPQLISTLIDVPTLTVNVTTTPIVTGITTPAVGVRTSSINTVVGAMGTDISQPAPVVQTGRNIVVSAPAMEIGLDFRGGLSVNPDFVAKTSPMEIFTQMQDAQQYISVDVNIPVTGAMQIGLEGTDATGISLQTDRVVQAPRMLMSTKMPGGYLGGLEDRYRTYVPTTVDDDDIWLKLNDASGNIAVDSLAAALSNKNDATYLNGPVLNSDGYRNRAAVEFDGVDDYLLMTTHYPSGGFAGMDATIEFSIQTTDLNGTIIRGGGNTSGENPGFAGTLDSEVRLVNGEIVIYGGSGQNVSYRTRYFVADGEWHHIVLSLPSATAAIYNSYNLSASRPFFLMADGEVVWSRFAPPLYGRSFLPTSFMGRAVFTAAVSGDPANVANYAVSENVSGKLADVVVRYHYAVSKDTAEKLYYEWSETLVITAEPMIMGTSMIAPALARGNTKRMIALYGLPYYLYAGDGVPTTRDGFGTYFSTFAGYYIENTGIDVPTGAAGSSQHVNSSSNQTKMQFLEVKPFRLEGYMVYPVAIANTPGSSGTRSAEGLENGEYRDPIENNYVDDRTGLPRFVDLDLDLREPITNFDAITAVNYPADRPWDGPENVQHDELTEFRQHNLGLTNNEWAAARDKLRDSILNAAYLGVNLWINEPHMAQHLEFIQAWDKHSVGDRFEFMGPGSVDPTGYTNDKAHQIDRAHLQPNVPDQWFNAVGVGQFPFTWQADSKRVIVSTEEGLTDIPGWEKTDQIVYYADNQWAPHSVVMAYDAIDRMAGLKIGDQLMMYMSEAGSYSGNYPAFNGWSVGVPRQFVVSAKPQGIVGKVISKELDFYYRERGQTRANPYKDNVYTIAAEIGSVVRGRAIQGRAFMEFMDSNITKVKIPIDLHPDMWNGASGENKSSWSFDTRRYKEIILLWILQKSVTRGDTIVTLEDEVRYVDIQDKEWDYKPYISMNARGLHWLAETEAIPAGEVRVFASPMVIGTEGADVTVSRTRNVTVAVTGTMSLDTELVEPASVDNPDVSVRARPFTMETKMNGLGTVVRAPAMQIGIETPDPVVTGTGDKIIVYMDSVTNITLFMEEE